MSCTAGPSHTKSAAAQNVSVPHTPPSKSPTGLLPSPPNTTTSYHKSQQPEHPIGTPTADRKRRRSRAQKILVDPTDLEDVLDTLEKPLFTYTPYGTLPAMYKGCIVSKVIHSSGRQSRGSIQPVKYPDLATQLAALQEGGSQPLNEHIDEEGEGYYADRNSESDQVSDSDLYGQDDQATNDDANEGGKGSNAGTNGESDQCGQDNDHIINDDADGHSTARALTSSCIVMILLAFLGFAAYIIGSAFNQASTSERPNSLSNPFSRTLILPQSNYMANDNLTSSLQPNQLPSANQRDPHTLWLRAQLSLLATHTVTLSNLSSLPLSHTAAKSALRDTLTKTAPLIPPLTDLLNNHTYIASASSCLLAIANSHAEAKNLSKGWRLWYKCAGLSILGTEWGWGAERLEEYGEAQKALQRAQSEEREKEEGRKRIEEVLQVVQCLDKTIKGLRQQNWWDVIVKECDSGTRMVGE